MVASALCALVDKNDITTVYLYSVRLVREFEALVLRGDMAILMSRDQGNLYCICFSAYWIQSPTTMEDTGPRARQQAIYAMIWCW